MTDRSKHVASGQKIIIAKIGKPVGVRGAFWVHSYCDVDIFAYLPWYIGKDSEQLNTQPLVKDACCLRRDTHKKRYLISLSSIETPDQARTICHHYLWVQATQLPSLADDEYYWYQLISCVVQQQDSCHRLGILDHFLRHGAIDIMVVLDGTKRTLIPFRQPAVVTKVDLVNAIIWVDWDVQ